MDKKTFHKKWYYRLLQATFFGSLIVFSLFLIIAGWFDSDVEIAGFFWAGVLAIGYWLIKRIFYSLMFGDRLLGRNQQGVFSGFIFGIIFSFLWIVIFSIIHPEEDLAGIMIIAPLISGLIFAFLGYLIQECFRKNSLKIIKRARRKNKSKD